MGRRIIRISIFLLICSAALILIYGCVNSLINPMAYVIGTPEISIIYDNGEISQDSTFSFGEVISGESRLQTDFTIRNLGLSTLTLPGGVLISGEDAPMFPVISSPATEVAPGGETVFTLAFAPYGEGGLKSADVSIESNDRLLGTITFTLEGKFTGVSVYLSTSASNPTNNSPITVNISFSEIIEGLTAGDIAVENGWVSSGIQQTGLKNYSVQISPDQDGEVKINIPAGVVVKQGSTHTNLAARELSFFYDGTSPTGSVTVNNGALGTNSLNTTLTLSCRDGQGTGVEKMLISNADDFYNADWENFSVSRAWVLSAGADGERNVYVKFMDYAGNISGIYNYSIIYDTLTPAAPGVPDLASEDDSGASDSDNITRQSTSLTFTGTAEADALVKIYSDIDGLAGSGYADGTGIYSVDANLSYSTTGDVEHFVNATATDIAGNESSTSPGIIITVQPPILNSVFISSLDDPESAAIIPSEIYSSEPLQLYAYGVQDGDSTIDITELVTWSSSSQAVAVIDSEGILTGIGGGAVRITASIVNASGTELSDTTQDITVIPSGGIDVGLE